MEIDYKKFSILNKIKGINYLIVEEENIDDNSVAQITKKKMEELKMFKAETVILKGRKKKKLTLVVLDDNSGQLSDNKIRLNEVARKNLGVKIGDMISINKCPIIPVGMRVKILPLEDKIKEITGNLTQQYIIPYFKDNFRPVTKGEIFVCKKDNNIVKFKVVDCEPGLSCIVGP